MPIFLSLALLTRKLLGRRTYFYAYITYHILYERRSKGDHLGNTFSKHPKAWRKLGAQPAQGKKFLGARFAQGLYCFLCKQPASTPASQHAHHPASHPASLIFCIFVTQALRKLRARCGARFTSFSAQPLSLTARELLHLTTPASNLRKRAY